MQINQVKTMGCPGCSKPLPFYFAFASGTGGKSCPVCNNIIAPTKKSMEKVRKMLLLFSFISGIPLGIVCCYLWLVALRPGLALIVFILGVGGVMGCSWYYVRANIRFCQHLPDS